MGLGQRSRARLGVPAYRRAFADQIVLVLERFAELSKDHDAIFLDIRWIETQAAARKFDTEKGFGSRFGLLSETHRRIEDEDDERRGRS
jgi:hypothetical protein